MKTHPTPETLLTDQLAACLEAMRDCIDMSRKPNAEDDYGNLRREDLAHVAKLMKASARLTEALAKLKGETSQNIRVTRQNVDRPVLDKPRG